MSTATPSFDLQATVRLAQAGDKTAFGDLVGQYKNLIFSVALGVLGDSDAARDVTQNVFLSAWQRLRELRSPRSVAPWLRETARRQALHQLRSTIRERSRLDRNPLPPSAAPNADEQLAEIEDSRALELALDQVPSDLREPLLLYYSEGQSVAQVAVLLDLSEDAVKKRCSARARRCALNSRKRSRRSSSACCRAQRSLLPSSPVSSPLRTLVRGRAARR